MGAALVLQMDGEAVVAVTLLFRPGGLEQGGRVLDGLLMDVTRSMRFLGIDVVIDVVDRGVPVGSVRELAVDRADLVANEREVRERVELAEDEEGRQERCRDPCSVPLSALHRFHHPEM